MAAPSSTAKESPEQTMARVKGELAASGQLTGQARQADIEQKAGVGRTPVTSATAPTPAEKITSNQQPVTAAGKFVDVVRQKATAKIAERRNALLSAPENYDTQIELQRGALYTALVDQASSLTPENLRWLTPDQQAAIRSGDQKLIKSAIVGLNSITQDRKDRQKEEREAKRQAVNDAVTKMQFYQKFNALDQISPEDQKVLETELGLSEGALKNMIEKQGTSIFEHQKLGDDLVELEIDRNTGKTISSRVVVPGSEKAGLSAKERLDAAMKIYDSGEVNSLSEAYNMVDQLVTTGNVPDSTSPLQVTIGNETRVGGSASWRNNNPGNIKYSDDAGNLTGFAASLIASGVDIQQGSKAMDGGYFITFPNIEAGSSAMKQLLSSGSYAKLDADAALKRWSNNGYGSEILPEELRHKTIGSMTGEEKDEVINRMIQREGFTPGQIKKPGETSEQETEAALRQALANVKPRLSSVAAQKDLQQTINKALNEGRIDDAKETIQQAALSTLTGTSYEKGKGRYAAIKNIKEIGNLINEYVASGGDMNLITGAVESFQENVLKRTGDADLANIANQITLAVIDYRSSVSGAAFTESELQQYNQVFPNIGNVPELNEQKINSLIDVFERNQKSELEYLIGPATYNKIFTPEKDFVGVSVVIDDNATRSYLQTVTLPGTTQNMTDDQITQIIEEMKILAKQGKTREEIFARVNRALGF